MKRMYLRDRYDTDEAGYIVGFWIGMFLSYWVDRYNENAYKRGREDERREWKG